MVNFMTDAKVCSLSSRYPKGSCQDGIKIKVMKLSSLFASSASVLQLSQVNRNKVDNHQQDSHRSFDSPTNPTAHT